MKHLPNTSRKIGRLNQLARLKASTGQRIIKMDMNSVSEFGWVYTAWDVRGVPRFCNSVSPLSMVIR